MRIRSALAALGLAAALAACNPAQIKMDPHLLPRAQAAYADVVSNKADALFEEMPPEFNTPQQRQTFALVRQMIPAGPGKPVMAGWRTFANIDGSQQQIIIYRYDYASGHITFTTTFGRSKTDMPWKLLGFAMTPSSASEIDAPSVGEDGPPPPERADAQKESAPAP